MSDVTCCLELPNQDRLFDHIRANASLARDVPTERSRSAQSVTICGAGPSLADHLDTLTTDEVWACNSALPYLMDRGCRVTHGFTVDQGKEMLGPVEWERTFDVTYLLGSSVHPELARHLTNQHRSTVWFHNYLGLKNPDGWSAPAGVDQTYEFFLYCSLYPPAPQVGYGLNSVPRAVCLALWMGFDLVRVIGADCAAKPNAPWMPIHGSPEWLEWLASVQLYADGRSALDAYGPDVTIVQSDIESRVGDPSTLTRWHTRPDMVISAVHLANMARTYPRLELVGNTLPAAMLDKPDDWFAACPQLNGEQGVTGFQMAYAEPVSA